MLQPMTISSNLSPESKQKITNDNILTLYKKVNEQDKKIIDRMIQGKQGVPGIAGLGANEYRMNFSYGDATPESIALVSAGTTIQTVTVIILTAFNGTGAALSVGIDGFPNLLMAASKCAPSIVATFMIYPQYKFTTSNTIKLFITPGTGATTGNGEIIINY